MRCFNGSPGGGGLGHAVLSFVDTLALSPRAVEGIAALPSDSHMQPGFMMKPMSQHMLSTSLMAAGSLSGGTQMVGRSVE